MKIGLTYTGGPVKHANYVTWIRGVRNNEVSRDIEVIKLSAGDDNFEDIRNCGGLVLSGGVDIHPSLYGGSDAYAKAPSGGWKKDRDLFEQSVLEYALGRGVPVLGICRGMQLINVMLGGTLIQDLGEAGDERHESIMVNDKQQDKQHGVRVAGGTLLHEIAGKEKGVANSAHHQAIDRLGEGLTVNCRADDGTIEGIEWGDPAGKPFLLGVQWHPERMFTNRFPDTCLYGQIRERLFDEIRKAHRG
jgi:putative glutamine amidotransferase